MRPRKEIRGLVQQEGEEDPKAPGLTDEEVAQALVYVGGQTDVETNDLLDNVSDRHVARTVLCKS